MTETNAIAWSEEDRAAADRCGVKIFIVNTTEKDIIQDSKSLPTDTHLVEYVVGGETYYDAPRAYKTVDIFDAYYDKLSPIGGRIVSIRNGYGSIKPKLYGYQAPESSPKKK